MSDKKYKIVKYNKLPVDKPEINELVWWINPQGKEMLGHFGGFSYNFPIFIGTDQKISSFHPKYWRKASVEDQLLVLVNPVSTPKPKRKKK